MLCMKQVTQYVPVNIDITGITLLSIEEYKVAEDHIPPLDKYWWLRSPGLGRDFAACVIPGFGVNGYGHYVYHDYGVRPALRINPGSVDFQIGDKVGLGGFTFTYISKELLLCDAIITFMPFRKDWQADDANEYEASDVKKSVDSWFAAVKTTTQP